VLASAPKEVPDGDFSSAEGRNEQMQPLFKLGVNFAGTNKQVLPAKFTPNFHKFMHICVRNEIRRANKHQSQTPTHKHMRSCVHTHIHTQVHTCTHTGGPPSASSLCSTTCSQCLTRCATSLACTRWRPLVSAVRARARLKSQHTIRFCKAEAIGQCRACAHTQSHCTQFVYKVETVGNCCACAHTTQTHSTQLQ